MTKKQVKSHPAKSKFEATSQEWTALEKWSARKNANLAPRLKVSSEEVTKVSPDHRDEAVGKVLLMEALGTADLDFFNGLINQLANVGAKGGKIDEGALNFMLSIIKDIKPKDQIEAMLAAQMAAVHTAIMAFARRLANVENIPQQDSAERAFNKLTRTFTTQVEALKRYRTGGEQKVTVQHVSVSDGGQAIVGNVTQAPSKTASPEASAAPRVLSHSSTHPMPIVNEPTPTRLRSKRKAK